MWLPKLGRRGLVVRGSHCGRLLGGEGCLPGGQGPFYAILGDDCLGISEGCLFLGAVPGGHFLVSGLSRGIVAVVLRRHFSEMWCLYREAAEGVLRSGLCGRETAKVYSEAGFKKRLTRMSTIALFLAAPQLPIPLLKLLSGHLAIAHGRGDAGMP